ncbi:GNAT family N-acetyltransferase [candidate division GN15 bacterium]|nr:GNAT family N-acetyltransferase [candidate division GN15 bacterium]
MSKLPDSVIIRHLSTNDSIEALTVLLNRSYQTLGDMGLKYVATYQGGEITRERIRNGQCIVAVCDDRLVGTITYHDPMHVWGTPWMSRGLAGHIGQLGVEPEWRGKGLGRALIDFAEAVARQAGVKEVTLDTAEPAEHLIKWYRRLGYRFVEYADWDVTNYRSVVMAKRL